MPISIESFRAELVTSLQKAGFIIACIVLALGGFGEAAAANGVQLSEEQSNAVSGERTKMGKTYYLNPDCSVALVPKETVLQKPLHGTVAFEKTLVFPNYRGGPLAKCNSKKVLGMQEYYTPAKGYSGQDQYKIRVSYKNGLVNDVTIHVNVIK